MDFKKNCFETIVMKKSLYEILKEYNVVKFTVMWNTVKSGVIGS